MEVNIEKNNIAQTNTIKTENIKTDTIKTENIKWITTQKFMIGIINFEINLNADQIDTLKYIKNYYEGAKLAIYDLDDTLVKSTLENKNTIIYHERIPAKIAKLRDDNYKIIIVTNQNGVNLGKTTITDVQAHIINLQKIIKVPLLALVSFDKDIYRKPIPGLWNKIFKDNGVVNFDANASFYCGDAGGLPKRFITDRITHEKIHLGTDFSDTDYKFALNLKLNFVHRDDFIYNVDSFISDLIKDKTVNKINTQIISRPVLNYVNFDTLNVAVADTTTNAATNTMQTIINDISAIKRPIMVIHVGFPGCGKSYITKKYFPAYKVCSQDILKTKAKCIKMVKDAVGAGENIVIDNTNIDPDMRKIYIDIAISRINDTANDATNNSKYYIVIIHHTASISLCKHNNIYREYKNYCVENTINHMPTVLKNEPNNTHRVPDITYSVMNKKYIPPRDSEISGNNGRIYNIDFCNETADPDYFMYFY